MGESVELSAARKQERIESSGVRRVPARLPRNWPLSTTTWIHRYPRAA